MRKSWVPRRTALSSQTAAWATWPSRISRVPRLYCAAEIAPFGPAPIPFERRAARRARPPTPPRSSARSCSSTWRDRSVPREVERQRLAPVLGAHRARAASGWQGCTAPSRGHGPPLVRTTRPQRHNPTGHPSPSRGSDPACSSPPRSRRSAAAPNQQNRRGGIARCAAPIEQDLAQQKLRLDQPVPRRRGDPGAASSGGPAATPRVRLLACPAVPGTRCAVSCAASLASPLASRATSVTANANENQYHLGVTMQPRTPSQLAPELPPLRILVGSAVGIAWPRASRSPTRARRQPKLPCNCRRSRCRHRTVGAATKAPSRRCPS